MESLNVFDWILIAIIVISSVFGLLRGFVKELLSLASWVAAFFVARLFSFKLSNFMIDWIGTEADERSSSRIRRLSNLTKDSDTIEHKATRTSTHKPAGKRSRSYVCHSVSCRFDMHADAECYAVLYLYLVVAWLGSEG